VPKLCPQFPPPPPAISLRMYQATAHQRLAKHKIPGFHAFRRYRISLMRELGVPEDLIRYAVGHSGRGITDRYLKLGENAWSFAANGVVAPAWDSQFQNFANRGPSAFTFQKP
jgi:integrase